MTTLNDETAERIAAGNYIRTAREARKFTRLVVQEHLNLSGTSRLKSIEMGQTIVPSDDLERLADLLKIDVKHMLKLQLLAFRPQTAAALKIEFNGLEHV
ncbi:helix-turn-helix domain-containing protein [Sulfitobacter sp. M22]|uniref:helix-turn-helix domain-containing protein n=1 Tax=Sulfitobacter sp. M22 TaxID=2675332 RepID=UPI001F1D5716|nr:helix-turn-helix transcriptional regulator [Sulfitobacter sp. M22]MCF7728688.1 helix-turn-helix domain-containing protein [Sulfitobacter sp. M22]